MGRRCIENESLRRYFGWQMPYVAFAGRAGRARGMLWKPWNQTSFVREVVPAAGDAGRTQRARAIGDGVARTSCALRAIALTHERARATVNVQVGRRLQMQT